MPNPLPSEGMDFPNAKSEMKIIPETVGQGRLFLDADLRVISADPLFYSSFHVTPEETEGCLIQDLGNGQWKSAALRELLQGAVSADRSFTDHEVDHDFPSGVGRKNMLLHGGRTEGTDHEKAVITIGFDDSTSRRAAEEVIRHAEVRYRRLFQTAKDGILILDAYNGRIIAANAFMEGLVGLETGELLGRQLYEIGLFKDIEMNKATFRELQRAKYIRYEHLPVQNQRGETVEVEFIANVYREGDRLVAQCNVRDISDRVRLEKKVAQQAVALADEARSKNEFLAMLSHELRNPLAPIRSALHLLKLQQNSDADPIQREALGVIDRQVGNLTKLVSDLLEVSRVINGRVHLAMQTVDMRQVVQHAVQTATPMLEQQHHKLIWRECAGPVWAKADPMRMEEVFVNLLNNAAKYTPEGGVIEVDCEAHGGEVWLHVRDNGIGIAEELLPRLFDLFTQAERSLDRAQGGLGIGLSLAHRLVELQGGTIQASSAGMGKGSTFTVCMPLIQAPVAAAVSEIVPAAEPTNGGTRVLVVDDNVDLVTMLGLTLRKKGYTVRTAHTGPDGVRLAQQWIPDIVLLDIGLPGLNGYQVARQLRAMPTTAGARIIALTGYAQEADIALTREAGFDEHMVKPYAFEELEKLMMKEQ